LAEGISQKTVFLIKHKFVDWLCGSCVSPELWTCLFHQM